MSVHCHPGTLCEHVPGGAEEPRLPVTVAISHNSDGIVAECGGSCASATCHVFVDDAFRALAGEPNDMEDAMPDLAPGR